MVVKLVIKEYTYLLTSSVQRSFLNVVRVCFLFFQLVEANTNWQKYNSERDAYVKRLLEEAAAKDAKISELQTQVTATNQKYQISEESRKQVCTVDAVLSI